MFGGDLFFSSDEDDCMAFSDHNSDSRDDHHAEYEEF